MADEQVGDVFVEVVSSVSHANGVFRITLGQQAEGGAVRPVTRLLIPAGQLQGVLRGIAEGANEIREKLQAAQAEDAGDKDGGGAGGSEGGAAKKKTAGRKSDAKK